MVSTNLHAIATIALYLSITRENTNCHSWFGSLRNVQLLSVSNGNVSYVWWYMSLCNYVSVIGWQRQRAMPHSSGATCAGLITFEAWVIVSCNTGLQGKSLLHVVTACHPPKCNCEKKTVCHVHAELIANYEPFKGFLFIGGKLVTHTKSCQKVMLLYDHIPEI